MGEDAVLHGILRLGFGPYADIGAGHKVAGSNTYALCEQGWRGILIDSIRANIDLSQRMRPGDVCIQAVMGSSTSCEIEFIYFDVNEYSTTYQ